MRVLIPSDTWFEINFAKLIDTLNFAQVNDVKIYERAEK